MVDKQISRNRVQFFVESIHTARFLGRSFQKHATHTLSKKIENLDSPAKRIHTLYAAVLLSCCFQCKRRDSSYLMMLVIFLARSL